MASDGDRMARKVPRGGTAARAKAWPVDVPLVFAAALIVRAVYLLESWHVPFGLDLVGDARGYYEWAATICGGNWWGSEPFYQAPLYPYVLSGVMEILGPNVAGLRVVQFVWGAVCCGLVCIWSGRLFGREAGLVAGLFMALCPAALFFDGVIQKASLASLLVAGLMCLMVGVEEKARARWVVGLGLVAGLLALTRENALVWVGIVGAWVWWVASRDGGRRRWRAIGLYVLGVACVLGPVAIRNATLGGGLTVTTCQAGPNFYIGNSANADGRYRPLVRGHETPAFERADATRLAEEAIGRALTPKEVSRYWFNRGWDDVVGKPGRWLRLMGIKLLMVVNRYEIADVESQYVYAESSILLKLLGKALHFGVLFPLAVIGIVFTWGMRRRLWVYYLLALSMIAAVALFFVLARYRFVLVPLMMPFVAVGCVELWRRIRNRAFVSLIRPVLVGCIVAAVVNWPVQDEGRLNALAYMNFGVAIASGEGGDLEEATRYLRLAVEGHGESPEAHFNLGQALVLGGDDVGGIESYRRALALEPDIVGVDFFLAQALERTGQREAALNHYRRALARDVNDRDARAGVERLGGLE